MNVLISCSSGRFDMVGYPKNCLLVESTKVKAEVNFWQETLLKKPNSRWKRLHGYRFSVDTLVLCVKKGTLAIIQAQQW